MENKEESGEGVAGGVSGLMSNYNNTATFRLNRVLLDWPVLSLNFHILGPYVRVGLVYNLYFALLQMFLLFSIILVKSATLYG